MSHPNILPLQSISSGSYMISGPEKRHLAAYLGSCVGVALWDSQAKLGGLIHMLLPEPTGLNNSFQPETYATTGLPMMITELLQKGASKMNLEACVAGGALVGPLSANDLILDLGGRTVEAVEQILSKEKIKIIKAETGGFFACCLSLDLSNGQSRIEPIGFSQTPAEKNFKKPQPAEIETTMKQVQPIPQIALKVIRMLADPNYHFQDIAQEIRQDQVISAKIISLCCSAYYGLKLNIDSIDRALLMLGEKKFLQLVVSASLQKFFPNNALGYSLCKGGLYKHALGTALVAECLARLLNNVSPDLAYTAGLLHDIGKVILDQYLAPAFPLFYRRIQLQGEELIKVEKEEFGITHAELGQRLGNYWSLPPTLVDVIQFHHHPDQALISPSLTHLIYLSDLIMTRYLVGQELERINPEILNQSLKRLGIEPEYLPAIIDNLPRQIFNI